MEVVILIFVVGAVFYVVLLQPERPTTKGAQQPVPFELPAQSTLRGRCWVIDGDTITIGDYTVRIAGIDAPELDHPDGRNAKSAMIGLCRGQTITAVVTGELSYHRVVARCSLPDGRDLAAELVKLGLALDWPKFSGGRYRHLETRDARRRLWRCDAKQKGRLPPAGRFS